MLKRLNGIIMVILSGNDWGKKERSKKMKYLQRHIKSEWIILGVFLVSLVFLAAHISPGLTFLPFNASDLTDFSQGWTDGEGQSVRINRLDVVSNKGQETHISKTLTEHLQEGEALNFRSKNIQFRVLVDGQVIYTFEPDMDYVASNSYGSCFHSVALPVSDGGKTLTIEYTPLYSDNSSLFDLMAIGNPGAYYQEFMHNHMPSFMVCVIIFLFGGITLGLSFSARRGGMYSADLRSLGCFAMMIGCWSGMETLVPQMLLGTTVIFHGLNYLLLILMPYPATKFINSLLKKPDPVYDRIISFAVVGDFIVTTFLNYSHILDYHQCLPIIHSVIIGTVVLFTVMILRDKKHRGKWKAIQVNRPITVAFLVLAVSGYIDLMRYIFSGSGSTDAGLFIRLGLLFFIVVFYFQSLRYIIASMRLAGETEAIRHLAYTDALTGMPNRTAFVKREKELEDAVASGEIAGIRVCQLDINDLKYVNDHFGHDYGDRYIMAAAQAITQAFESQADCFRMGGDEFTVFLTLEQGEDDGYSQCIRNLDEVLEARNRREDVRIPLSIARGSAVYTADCGHSLEEVEQEADHDMYSDKQSYFHAEYDRRRGHQGNFSE